MRRILKTVLVAALLAIGAPLFAAAAAQAAPAAVNSAVQSQDVQAALPGPPVAATPSPSGPVNPGTGETGQAEGTRLDWTPLVVGAVVLIALVAAIIWRRRRRNTTVV